MGPALSREAHVIAPFAKSVGIPAVSYSATDPELFNRNAYPAFYRTIPSDNAAALAIVKLFIRFKWISCIVIYQTDAFGSGGADAISKAFNNNGLTISETLAFDITTFSFRGDLKTILLSLSTRIVLVWADTVYTTFILQQAIDNDVLGPQFLWILSTSISLTSFNKTSFEKLIGILSLEPVVGNVVDAPINTTLLNATYDIWQKYERETFPGPGQVDIYALFAFDATWLLIQSLQQLCSTNTNSSISCLSIINASLCFNRYLQNGNSLFNTINTIEFLGISGPIHFSINSTDRINGAYYVVKNIQPLSNSLKFLSVLVWSDSNEWTLSSEGNTILWPGSSLASPTGIAGLFGVNLRIGVIKSSPYTMITDKVGQNSTNLIGFVPDLIDILKTRMGFIPNIILASSNATYSGMVTAVANGIYDIVIGDLTVTSKRKEIVDFSAAIFDNSVRVVVRQAVSDNVDLFSYLKPFSLNLWLALLATCIYAAILMCLLERRENEALRDQSLVASSSLSIWYSFGTLMGYGADFQAKTAAGRIITVGLYILSLILVATYTANLASNLTISRSKTVISGIDDIKNGKLPFSRVGIITESSIEDYYLREISDNVRNFYPLKNETDLYNSLLNSIIDASIMDIGNLEYSINKFYCNLTLAGTSFAASAYGIVVPKQWIYLRSLDINILSLRELGVLDDLRRKWFEGKTCSDLPTTDSVTSIDFFAISGLFLTFAVITGLALLLFIWKKRLAIKYYFYTKTHSIQPRPNTEPL